MSTPEQNYNALEERLAKRPDPVRNDAPPAIINAPAPEPAQPSLTFRAYQDGTFAKFCPIKEKPGWYALCLNTSAEGQKDALHQVAAVCDYAISNMICEGVNLLIGLQLRLRIEQEALKKTPAAEQTVDVPATVTPEAK